VSPNNLRAPRRREQFAVRVVEIGCAEGDSAVPLRSTPGRAERTNSQCRSAVRKVSLSSSTDQHAPPMAVSSSVVTMPPCTMKPSLPSWKQ
jgi:hypothetical protein